MKESLFLSISYVYTHGAAELENTIMRTTAFFLMLSSTYGLAEEFSTTTQAPCTRLFAGHDCVTPLDTSTPVASDASICMLLELHDLPSKGATLTRTYTHTDIGDGWFSTVGPCLDPMGTGNTDATAIETIDVTTVQHTAMETATDSSVMGHDGHLGLVPHSPGINDANTYSW